MSAIWAFHHIENKHSLYGVSLREHAVNVIDFEKKMLPLTEEELKLH